MCKSFDIVIVYVKHIKFMGNLTWMGVCVCVCNLGLAEAWSL